MKRLKDLMMTCFTASTTVDIILPRQAGTGACAALSRSDVSANFDPQVWSRKTCSTLESDISRRWDEKCSKNPRMYNGSKFRLGGLEEKEGKLVIKIGLTCYQDLCGTNLAPNFRQLQEKGYDEFGNRQAFMADPIGVGLLALTKDGSLVVVRRADWTGESPGALDRPGGHPEPDRVFLPDESLRPELRGLGVDGAVLREVWESALVEAEDELGLDAAVLGRPALLGVTLNTAAASRPSLEFFTRLSADSRTVAATYRRGQQTEADETTGLHLVSPATLALLPKLLTHPQQKLDNQGGKEGGGPRDAYEEARWLLQEATPALLGALHLALHHRLLPDYE